MILELIFGIGLLIGIGLMVFSPKSMQQMKATHGLIGVFTPWVVFIWIVLAIICAVMAMTTYSGDFEALDRLEIVFYVFLAFTVMALIFIILLITGAGRRLR